MSTTTTTTTWKRDKVGISRSSVDEVNEHELKRWRGAGIRVEKKKGRKRNRVGKTRRGWFRIASKSRMRIEFLVSLSNPIIRELIFLRHFYKYIHTFVPSPSIRGNRSYPFFTDFGRYKVIGLDSDFPEFSCLQVFSNDTRRVDGMHISNLLICRIW